MSKTSVDVFLNECQLEIDYSITDTDLDTLTLSLTNKAIKRVKSLLKDFGFIDDIRAGANFVTIEDQEYRDIGIAVVVGDTSSFTGIANDKLKVTIDSTDYDDIDISASTSIADLVTAINAATSGTEASETTDGYLQITSTTSGSTSNVTVADGTNTGQTVVGDIFDAEARRTSTGIDDLDKIITLTERVNDRRIPLFSWDVFRGFYTDPTASSSQVPDAATQHRNRIYFGPRPSQSILIYMDYYKLFADVAAGGTMPFEDKYDILLAAMVKLDLIRFLDNTNAIAIADYKQEIKGLTHDLITAASRPYSRQASSRREESPYIRPRAR